MSACDDVPQCVRRRKGGGHICVRPNKYTQFRTLNKQTPYDGSYQEHKANDALINNDDARCDLNKLNSRTKAFGRLKFVNDLPNRAAINAHVSELRAQGWTKLPTRVNAPGIAHLRGMGEQTLDVYNDIIDVDEDVIEAETGNFRDVKYRDGRLDVLVPSYRPIINECRGKWLHVINGYLEHLDEEQTDILQEIVDDSDNDDDERAVAQSAMDHLDTRDARILSASLLRALPRSGNQDWHADPADVSPHPSTLNVAIALDAVTMRNGPTQLIDMDQEDMALDNPAIENNPSIRRFMRGKTVRSATLLPGQIFMFDARCIHRGSGNKSSSNRDLCFLIYGTSLTPDAENTYNDLAKKEGYFAGQPILEDMMLPYEERSSGDDSSDDDDA
jgi:hypothetical protein